MLMHLQDTRYSMGYFLWPRHHDKIQGRKGLYPPITMAEFMKTKGVCTAASLVPVPCYAFQVGCLTVSWIENGALWQLRYSSDCGLL